MVQVTSVLSPLGLKAKSELIEPSKGLMKSTLSLMASFGSLSTMVILPSPTLSLPDQPIDAPCPASGPSKVIFAAGSSLAHGDQASHLCRSFTCPNTASAGAAIAVVRSTRNSEG